MKTKTTILNECVEFINKFEILEYHIFIKYIAKNSIYFYELISQIKNDKINLEKIIVMPNTPTNNPYKYHYKTIHKKFILYSNLIYI